MADGQHMLPGGKASWQVENHGVNRHALIKAYDVLVKSPEERKKLERTAPLLVAARDQAVVELKLGLLGWRQLHLVGHPDCLKAVRSMRAVHPKTGGRFRHE